MIIAVMSKSYCCCSYAFGGFKRGGVFRESSYNILMFQFEKELMDEWENLYQSARNVAKDIKSIDTERFLKECEFVQKAYFIKNY